MIVVSLCVLQGDAAFWWNLKKSGDGDMLTRHAGCPVLVGTKWGQCTCFIKPTFTCILAVYFDKLLLLWLISVFDLLLVLALPHGSLFLN